MYDPRKSEVVIYTTNSCPFCVKAKNLLTQRGFTLKEIDLTDKPAERQALVKKSGGRRTVPQIFIDGTAIGGFDDLANLDRAGALVGASPV